jgi:hypothetical protein
MDGVFGLEKAFPEKVRFMVYRKRKTPEFSFRGTLVNRDTFLSGNATTCC